MNLKILLLTGRELEELLKPEILIDEIGRAFALFSEGRAVMPPRTVMWIEDNWWGVMQAYVPNYGVGVKIVNVIPTNIEKNLPTIQALVTLFDPITGSPLAILEGNVLTALRTGAASAVSAKYMAPRTEGAIAIIGTGFQARYQLRFVSSVFETKDVKIYDLRPKAMELFKKYAESLGFNVTICNSPREAVKGARIVIEATTTEKPVVFGESLEPPVHVISIGAPMPQARALDDEVIRRAENIVVDSREAVMRETGDIRIPVKEGILKIDQVIELGEVVTGKKPGRIGNGITIFKSVGLAIQDACAAGLAYKLAKERNIGTEIEL